MMTEDFQLQSSVIATVIVQIMCCQCDSILTCVVSVLMS